jgi:hypothetical protein
MEIAKSCHTTVTTVHETVVGLMHHKPLMMDCVAVGRSRRPIGYSKYASSCAYGGAQRQRKRSGSVAVIVCQVPERMRIASPGPTI